MDIDHNRNITVAEMDAADAQAEGEMSSAQKIALHDENKDGILSIDEHQATIEAQFEVVDVNADGSIDVSELKSGVPVRVPQP
jgi:Ca2+-binding EF-hand superfamily protein